MNDVCVCGSQSMLHLLLPNTNRFETLCRSFVLNWFNLLPQDINRNRNNFELKQIEIRKFAFAYTLRMGHGN